MTRVSLNKVYKFTCGRLFHVEVANENEFVNGLAFSTQFTSGIFVCVVQCNLKLKFE